MEAGNVREIVPYELIIDDGYFWISKGSKRYFRKIADIGCDVEDCYACVLDYNGMVEHLLVYVVERNALKNRPLILKMHSCSGAAMPTGWKYMRSVRDSGGLLIQVRRCTKKGMKKALTRKCI